MNAARALRAALFVVLVTVAAASIAVVGSNTNARLDLTASGQHRLGERTLARLDSLDVPVELVVAVARDRLDPRARDRVDDVLAALDHASPALRVSLIDTGSSQGPALYRSLIARLEAREAGARERRAMLTADTSRRAGELASGLTSFDASVQATAQTAQARAPRLGEFAAFARVAARQIAEANENPSGELVGTLAALARQIEPQLGVIAGELGAMQAEARDEEARLRLRDSARAAAELRDRAAVLARVDSQIERTDLDRVAGAIETGEAVLLIGPPREDGPGLVAINIDEFYPPRELFEIAGAGAEAETAVRAEQLVASALAVLTDASRPIVVFVHGEPMRWVGQAGVMTALLERMGRAGIDHAEWAVVVDDAPPDLAAIDPGRRRPAVYCVISPNSAVGSDPGNPASLSGAERAARVGGVLASLVARGEALLVNLNPSVFPTFGDADPIASALAPLGLDARSGTPILARDTTAAGHAATTAHRVIPRASAHPIGSAIAGLPVVLEWAVPIDIASGADAAPLLTMPASNDTWAESQWLRFWRTPRAQRRLLLDHPAFDEGDTRGPWAVAAAARGAGTGGPRSRAVLVGSNTWLLDASWQTRRVVEGRPVLAHPGNVELFDASVLWLAGRDELIAPGQTARPITLVRPVSEGALGALRWMLIGGMPLLILALGAVWRALRG